MRIGLDILGGDFAPEATTLGAILAKQALGSEAELVLIGDEPKIVEILQREGASKDDFTIVHAPEVIGMGEHPTKAFAKKPNSSITVGYGLLKQGQIDVFASSGNTGAMLVGAMYTVKAVSGVIRPSITSVIPKEDGGVGIILDVGINADCKPDVLYQFGILGSLLAEHIFNIDNPRVGLLNIGEEEEKGNLLTQAAHEVMKDSRAFNFIGNIEGRDLLTDRCDVVVCDGYTGNVLLKQMEGMYAMIKKRGIQDDYFDRFNFENYGGTPILGINSNVIIGHGISNADTIKNMIMMSRDVVQAKLSERIKKAFE